MSDNDTIVSNVFLDDKGQPTTLRHFILDHARAYGAPPALGRLTLEQLQERDRKNTKDHRKALKAAKSKFARFEALSDDGWKELAGQARTALVQQHAADVAKANTLSQQYRQQIDRLSNLKLPDGIEFEEMRQDLIRRQQAALANVQSRIATPTLLSDNEYKLRTLRTARNEITAQQYYLSDRYTSLHATHERWLPLLDCLADDI